jgi:hypothetical protein
MDTMQVEIECRRKAEEDRVKAEMALARQKNTEDRLNMAMNLYIAQIIAPWQVLADQIRSEMR